VSPVIISGERWRRANSGFFDGLLVGEAGIISHEPNFHGIDFAALFEYSDDPIDIVNTYGGSWLNSRLGTIRGALENREVLIRVCITRNQTPVARVAAAKHGQSLKEFNDIVQKTISRLKGLCRSRSDLTGRLQIYLSERPIVYTAYRFGHLLIYAPLPISSEWPRSPLPVLVLDAERSDLGSFAASLSKDIDTLFRKDAKLVYDSNS